MMTASTPGSRWKDYDRYDPMVSVLHLMIASWRLRGLA
jgi:hypothetical protein